jgi:sugar lactone lactonase YvrE
MRILLAALAAAALMFTAGASAVSGNGTIYTVAGTGAAAFSGDGGKATSATLNTPTGLAVDAGGNLYIADTGNHRIRKVSPAGVITTIAGTGSGGFSGDGGPATAAQLLSPSGLALDGRGGLFVADTGNNRVRHIAADGTITTVAGNGVEDQSEEGTPALEAALNEPAAVAVDGAGSLYVAERDRVLRIPGDGRIHTVAGHLYDSGYNGDNLPGPAATLYDPQGLAVDAAGNVYIADSGTFRIRKVGTDGIIRTVAGAGGNYEFGGDGGPATAALLNDPRGVALGSDGSIYFADHGNHRIRKVLPDGIIITVAGGGESKKQFGPATKADIGDAVSVAIDRAGNVYFADASRNRVEKISDLTTEVGTVARGWVSASRTGPSARRLSNELPGIWAHFLFAEEPAAGLPIVVEFYGPHGKLGAIQKPHAKRIDAVLQRQRKNAVFAPGKWRAVLRVAGKPLKTVSFTVAAFDIK